MRVVVAGCGRVGASLAVLLSREGHYVAVIDNEALSFKRLTGDFRGFCVEGAAFDENALLEARAKGADAFVAVTGSDETNLMASLVARNVFGATRVLSRLNRPGMKQTFSHLGVDHVCGAHLVAGRIAELVFPGRTCRLVYERKDLSVRVYEYVSTPDRADSPAPEPDDQNTRMIAHSCGSARSEAVVGIRAGPGDRCVLVTRGENAGGLFESADEASPGVFRDEDMGAGRSSVVVGGFNRVGALLARRFCDQGLSVTVIDGTNGSGSRSPVINDVVVVHGPVTDEGTLLEAGIEKAAAFTPVTGRDSANLMSAEIARHVFNVPGVAARILDSAKAATCHSFSTWYACDTEVLSRTVLGFLLRPEVHVRSICLLPGRDLVEFHAPRQWAGKSISSIGHRTGIIFAYVARKGSPVLPDGGLSIEEGDEICALSTPGESLRLKRQIEREGGRSSSTS